VVSWRTLRPELTTGLFRWDSNLTRGGGAACNRTVGTLIKKENKIFLIFKEIQKGAVAKTYIKYD
jgi:hypothetical protein